MDPEIFLPWALAQLQQRPERYRLFGVYWWAVKAALRHRYTTANLYMLGAYRDRESADRVPSFGSKEDLLDAALAEYERNLALPYADGRVEDPDGELVAIVDQDAGGL